MNQKSIKKNMLMNIILTLSNFVFPLVTFSYISRILTPVGTGKVAFVSSLLSYFIYISSLGIPAYGLREASKVKENKEKLSKLILELFVINIVSTLISYLLLFISITLVDKLHDYKHLILIMSTSIILTSIGFEWLYNALEEYTYITIRSLIFKIIYIPLVFILIKNPDDYLWYGFLSIFVTSANYICNFINIRNYIDLKLVKHLDLKKHIKPILILFSASIIINVYANFDVVMIGFIRDEWSVGLYNTALKIKTIILSISTATTAVLIPRIAKAISEKDNKESNRLINLSIKTSLLFAIPLALFVIINSRDVILFLFGEQYLESLSTLIVLMLCIIPLVFTNIFGNQVLIQSGNEKKFTISVFIGMFINLFLNILLIPKFGSFGAAIGTLITEIWNVIYMGYYANKVVRDYTKELQISKFAISFFISISIDIIVVFLLQSAPLIIRLFASGITFFTIYYSILIINKEALLFSQIKKYIKRK